MEAKRKIRILHVAQSAGGVDRYLKMLIKYLNTDYENILVCSFDYKESEYKGLADKVIQIPMQREIEGKKDLKAIKEIRKIIKEHQPDIVYAHSSKAGALTRIANIGIKNHCVYNPHGWAFNMRCSKLKKFIYSSIERVLAPLCNTIICISEAEKQSALKQKICSEKKLEVIFNGVDIDAYIKNRTHTQVSRELLGIPENAYVIGASGRLSAQKAPDVYIRAAKMIKDKIPEAHFMMVGDGELKDEVMAYAKKHGIEDSLTITGWVKEPMDYVGLFDAAMLLSRWEGFGLALPEYMMASKPIVASNVDAIPNLIKDEVNGILVEPDDPEAVCDAIVRLHTDNEFSSELVENGKIIVKERFDAKRAAREHEMMFEKMVGNLVENREERAVNAVV